MQVGIMQGRLSPPQENHLQFFPHDWEAEFSIARATGFETIEWIFDNPETNPITTNTGRHKLRSVSKRHGIFVKSICADVFMEKHLTEAGAPAVDLLTSLLKQAAHARIPSVMVPFVESNLPETKEQFEAVAENIREALSRDKGRVDLTLEVDLPAERIIALIEAIDSPRVGVCYDTGNAMTFDFDAGADIRTLGRHIKEVHIKDRIRGTRQSVYLGDGSVDFPDVFDALREVGFDGLCILQAWRGEDYLGDAKRHLKFVKDFIQP